MFTNAKLASIRSAVAQAFTQLLFAATVAIVVGGTAALALEPAIQYV